MIQKGIVRLVPVQERDEILLGQRVRRAALYAKAETEQLSLFPSTEVVREERLSTSDSPDRSGQKTGEQTTLDRLHRAMLLFGAGETGALRRLLEEERRAGRRFQQLASALTPLYPPQSVERRWLEGLQSMIRR